MRRAWLVMAVAGCGGDAAGSGRVAFSDPTGDLVVVDLASGDRRTIDAPGAPGAIAISRDGGQVGFAVEPELFRRRIHVADLDSGVVHAILPETGEQMAAIHWGPNRLLNYGAFVDGESRQFLAEPGAPTAQQLGAFDPSQVVFSNAAALVGYSDCADPVTSGPCTSRRVVVEDIDGDTVVLASGGTGWAYAPVAFTADGAELVAIFDAHLVAYAVDGSGSPRDLGAADYAPYVGPVISPDGREVLVLRGAQLVAVSIDGSGERLLSDDFPLYAGFTATGDVWYTLETDTEVPPDDTPEYVYTLRLVRGDQTLTVSDGEPDCFNEPTISPSGRLGAWMCGGVTIVVSLDDAAELRRIDPGGHIAGFAADDAGLVLASNLDIGEYDLTYVGLDGATRDLGTALYQMTANGNVEWPPFAYAP